MGTSGSQKGGKAAPAPISMHPTKGGGHPTAGMGGTMKGNTVSTPGGIKSSALAGKGYAVRGLSKGSSS